MVRQCVAIRVDCWNRQRARTVQDKMRAVKTGQAACGANPKIAVACFSEGLYGAFRKSILNLPQTSRILGLGSVDGGKQMAC